MPSEYGKWPQHIDLVVVSKLNIREIEIFRSDMQTAEPMKSTGEDPNA